MSVIEELFGVKGKTVLVTGGGRGIGQHIAEAFVKAGAKVYICSRDLATCQATAKELSQYGTCIGLACDIAKTEDRKRFVAEFSALESKLDVLINNAGAVWAAPLDQYPESGWDKVFNLNVRGLFFMIRDLLPLLGAAGTAEDPARIINIGSINALHIPDHETYAYPASKAAVHHLTKDLADKLAVRHITANVIAPGLFPTDMLKGSLDTNGFNKLVAPIPLKRLTGPSDMAGAAIYLASKAGSYLTGAVIPVDGGYATTI